MADCRLHSITLLPTTDDQRRAAWQPRLQLYNQTTKSADNRRPVLYIHGGTFSSECSIFFKFGGLSWADELNRAGFSAWGLDFAGFGRSERYPDMKSREPGDGEPVGRCRDTAPQVERAARAILAQTGATRLSIVAHSWGTLAACCFAGEHPELVERLVLFGPIIRRTTMSLVPSLKPWRFLTVAEQWARFVEDVPAGEPGVLEEDDFPAWAELYLSFDPTSTSRTPPSVRTPNGPVADVMEAWSGTLPYDPARIRAPILIVRGEWDSLCTDADAAWLRQACTSAPCVSDVKIPKATHLMHLERGRRTLYAATSNFLREE